MDFISKHIFFFPFTWVCGNERQDKFLSVAPKGWKRLSHQTLTDRTYNELVYFFRPAGGVLYERGGSDIVKLYEKDGLTPQDTLTIEVEGERYQLQLKAIKLKLYCSGVALLTIEAINSIYQEESAIIAINGMSKSVYPYFLPLEEARKDYFPERLIFRVGHEEIIESYNGPYKERPMRVASFLMGLLGASFVCEKKQVNKQTLFVKPILNNRMFVLCLYRSSIFLEKMKKAQKEAPFMTEWMVFSRKQKMTKTIYLALDKMVYTIGRHAFIGVVDEEVTSPIYDELTTLALVQKVSLLHFSGELAEVATLPKGEIIEGVENLYGRYIQFINQMYFREVTIDVQGSNIYEKLLEALRVQEELKELDFEMREVHEYSALIQRKQQQIRIDFLTILGTILVIPTFVTGFFGMNILENYFIRWWVHREVALFLNSYMLLPIVVVLLIYCLCTRYHKYYKTWIVLLSIMCLISLGVLILQGCGLV